MCGITARVGGFVSRLPTTTARRLRPPPPCLSRSHGPSDRWPATNAAIRNSMQHGSLLRRRGSA